MSAAVYPLAAMPQLVGQTLGTSDWVQVDQSRIDSFAHATGDDQWIHVDAQRAVGGPFGTTIAHGFLTLSLLPVLMTSAFSIDGVRMSVNYGLDRLRFLAPVPVNSRLRGHFRLLACDAIEGGAQLKVETTIEREGAGKPVCVAEALSRCFR
ncbi:MaoC family dehydratase [Caballeronia sp. SEWSISQ10-4 2]|uniref:MaoC family dehydratase n=1 Tax=Caballeronia sp. SEWSISQ10-4 2 TaxID=2937438 RepID=UPI0026566E08|nr:MaoC family dehydratase [Caballeronia sp. SEWSISQ10-4 2]MDN7179486.1 MaoC family dehydratase [Caballeronia sp. SEWSISQ10-4 2]